jgi:hypothetical protein
MKIYQTAQKLLGGSTDRQTHTYKETERHTGDLIRILICLESRLILSHYHFLSNPFKFNHSLITYHSTLYNLSYWKAPWNKLKKVSWFPTTKSRVYLKQFPLKPYNAAPHCRELQVFIWIKIIVKLKCMCVMIWRHYKPSSLSIILEY